MEPQAIVHAAIKGLEKDQYETYPGIARMIKIMSRVAPAFILKQLSKPGANEMAG